MQAGLVVGAGTAHVKRPLLFQGSGLSSKERILEPASPGWISLIVPTTLVGRLWTLPLPTAATCQRSPALELVTTLP